MGDAGVQRNGDVVGDRASQRGPMPRGGRYKRAHDPRATKTLCARRTLHEQLVLVQRSLRLEALVIMAWTAERANLHAGLLVIPFRHLGTLPFCDDAPGTLAHHRMVFVFLGLPFALLVA